MYKPLKSDFPRLKLRNQVGYTVTEESIFLKLWIPPAANSFLAYNRLDSSYLKFMIELSDLGNLSLAPHPSGSQGLTGDLL